MVENMDDAKTANRMRGLHFFESGTMKFFRSRIVGDLVTTPAGSFFITSEQFDRFSPRKYTVRQFHHHSAGVSTVGTFQGYTSVAAARNAIPREVPA